MTDEEARRLQPGNRVRLSFRGRAYLARVISVTRFGGMLPPRVRIQPEGRTEDGSLFARRTVSPKNLYRPEKHDEATANIFADWLEEAGFIDAAHALRKAFPFDRPQRATHGDVWREEIKRPEQPAGVFVCQYCERVYPSGFERCPCREGKKTLPFQRPTS